MWAPQPARFAHVVLQSPDMQRLKDWYSTAFPLEIFIETERAVIASYDDEHHRFAFVQVPGAGTGDEPSTLKHLAYAFDTLDEFIDHYAVMKAAGHKPKECVNHGPTLSFYYEDPDGNGVEFFVDRFDTMEQSKAFMRSEVFKKNMFGYFVDPDLVEKQFRDGVSPAKIMEYDQESADRFLRDSAAASES